MTTINQNLEDNGPYSTDSLLETPRSQDDSQTTVPIGSTNMRESSPTDFDNLQPSIGPKGRRERLRNRLTRGARKVQEAVKRVAARARSGVQRVVVGGAEKLYRKYRPQRQTQSEY